MTGRRRHLDQAAIGIGLVMALFAVLVLGPFVAIIAALSFVAGMYVTAHLFARPSDLESIRSNPLRALARILQEDNTDE